MKKIIVLGDSFTYGHGCSDRVYYYDHKNKKYVGEYFDATTKPPSEFSWPSLLQKDYPQYEVINLAKGGTSNQTMARDFMEYKQNNSMEDVALVMFNSTFIDRIEVASYQHLDATHNWLLSWDIPEKVEPAEYTLAKKLALKCLINDDILGHQATMSLLSVKAFAQHYGIKFLWSTVFEIGFHEFHSDVLNEFNEDRFPHIYKYDYSGTMDFDFNSKFVAEDNHTNTLGHIMYYKKVILPKLKTIL